MSLNKTLRGVDCKRSVHLKRKKNRKKEKKREETKGILKMKMENRKFRSSKLNNDSVVVVFVVDFFFGIIKVKESILFILFLYSFFFV